MEEESSETPHPKVITYNVNPKKRAWGRRQADKQTKKKKNLVQIPNPNPKFKGKVKVPKQLLKKYSRGEGINKTGIKTTIHQKKIEKKEKVIKFATIQAARAEVLLTEEDG